MNHIYAPYAPYAWCKASHAMVRTDQTQAQCASGHTCPSGRVCPLGALFANIHAANRTPRSSHCAK